MQKTKKNPLFSVLSFVLSRISLFLPSQLMGTLYTMSERVCDCHQGDKERSTHLL